MSPCLPEIGAYKRVIGFLDTVTEDTQEAKRRRQIMSDLDRSSLLRRALLADAALSATTGLLIFGGASFLADLLVLPEPLLRYAGLGLIPYAAFVAYVATREDLNPTAVWAVIVLNVLWVLESILLMSG